MNIKKLGTPKVATTGVWCTLENFGDAEFLIAAAGNKKYNEFIQKKSLTLKRGGFRAKAEEIVREGVATHILLDWKNVTDDNGAPVEYTPSIGITMFKDSEFFYQAIVEESENLRANIQDYDEEAEKN